MKIAKDTGRSDHRAMAIVRHGKRSLRFRARQRDARPWCARVRGWRPTTLRQKSEIRTSLTGALDGACDAPSIQAALKKVAAAIRPPQRGEEWGEDDISERIEAAQSKRARCVAEAKDDEAAKGSMARSEESHEASLARTLARSCGGGWRRAGWGG